MYLLHKRHFYGTTYCQLSLAFSRLRISRTVNFYRPKKIPFVLPLGYDKTSIRRFWFTSDFLSLTHLIVSHFLTAFRTVFLVKFYSITVLSRHVPSRHRVQKLFELLSSEFLNWFVLSFYETKCVVSLKSLFYCSNKFVPLPVKI